MSQPPVPINAGDDDELLRRGIENGGAAIDALIRRYAGFVYGIALRQTRGDQQMAADISQAVFVVFIRKIRSIRSARSLPGWLHKATCYAVQNALRAAERRRRHEQQAARSEQFMDTTGVQETAGLELIDGAIASLGRTDRDLILMRYMQGREVASIAMDIGISEQTARKRITRAVERMRNFFASRGVTLGAGSVTGLLTIAASQSAPAGVIEMSAAAAAGGSSPTAATIAKGVFQMMTFYKLKLAAIAIVLTILTTAGVAMLQQQPAPRSAAAPTTVPTVADRAAALAATMHPAQQAVEAYFAAASRNDEPAAAAIKNAPTQTKDAREILAMNGGSIPFDYIEADDTGAMIVSKPIGADQGRSGSLFVAELVKTDGQWRIKDMDIAAKERLLRSQRQFQLQHPTATRIAAAVAPTSRPAE